MLAKLPHEPERLNDPTPTDEENELEREPGRAAPMEGYGGSGEIGDGATYGVEREELEFGGAFGKFEMECELKRWFGEVDGKFKAPVEIRRPCIWAGVMRSGSASGFSVSSAWFGVELSVSVSVSVSSSELSWISPRPVTPMFSDGREKSGAVDDKILEGEVGIRIGSMDRNDGEVGVWLSESLIGLLESPSPKKSFESPVARRIRVPGRVIMGEGGVNALECLRSKTGESMTASQSSQ